MLNNKKTKFVSRKKQQKMLNNQMRTEPIEREIRNSIELEEPGLNDSFDDTRNLGNRVVTEASLLVSDKDISKDYFKKPLKLLKKKIQENKQKSNLNSQTNFTNSYTDESSTRLDFSKVQVNERGNPSKIRTVTERSAEEVVINTELAKKERDRMYNEQVHMRRQR